MIVFIAIFQSVLFLGHVFLYETWNLLLAGAGLDPAFPPLQLTLAILSVSFLATSLLAFRYNNIAVAMVLHRLRPSGWAP